MKLDLPLLLMLFIAAIVVATDVLLHLNLFLVNLSIVVCTRYLSPKGKVIVIASKTSPSIPR